MMGVTVISLNTPYLFDFPYPTWTFDKSKPVSKLIFLVSEMTTDGAIPNLSPDPL